MKSKRRIAVLLGVSAIFVVGGSGYFLAMRSNSRTEQVSKVLSDSKTTINDEASGLHFTFIPPLVKSQLTDRDIEDGFLFRISSNDPAVLISIRTESKLRSLAALTKQDLIPLVFSNARRSLPSRYTNYKEISAETDIVIAGRKASRIDFSYNGPSGKPVAQSLVMIKKDDDTALYVSFQTTENEFNSLAAAHLTPLLDSLKISK